MWRPLGSKSVGVRAKIRLEDSFEDQLQCSLHHAIADAGDLERAEFAVSFWDIYPAVRLGLAIVVNPLLFFSKKRRHFLTVGYQDGDGKQQAAVFELGKDVVRVTLATLEARTGRKIEYEDEDARNSGRGN